MKKTMIKFSSLLLCFLLVFHYASASKLVKVRVVDKDYLMIYFIDGEVTFVDDGLGDCAFLNICHDESNDNLIRYDPALDLTQVINLTNWRILSDNDPNYGTTGSNPTSCHRKSKLNGMEQTTWNSSTWDFNYEYTMEHTIYLKLPTSMVQGGVYTLNINASTNTDVESVTFTYDIFNSQSEAVHTNLVGYSTDAGIKAADLYLWMGDGGARDYSGFIGKKVYIYNVDTEQSQEVGNVAFWKAAASEGHGFNMTQSDVYSADFTGFAQEGNYRVAIEDVGCSQDFKISSSIYYEPLMVSTLGYFYMRIGQDSTGGISPVPRRPLYIPGQSPVDTKVYITTLHPLHPDWGSFSGDVWDRPENWVPYLKASGPTQNSNAWGGHSDAADWDRHLSHVSNIYDILLPYFITNGSIAEDNMGIAESGNGIPDLIDEARNEVDFWLRLRDGMAYSHGLTCPTGDHEFYQAGTTAIAAWANAANAAMIANCFQIAGLNDLANEYRDSAVVAYNFASAMSQADQLLDTKYDIGDVPMRGRDFKVMAAAFLYNVTGETGYEDVINNESVATSNTSAIINEDHNQLYATAAYLFTQRTVNYPDLYNRMRASIINDAKQNEANYSLSRPSRRGTDRMLGYWKTAQNTQRSIVAHAIADAGADKDLLLNSMILEADWGLGRNPLNMIQMTTASTSLGSKRSVENVYSTGGDDGVIGMHPGHTPYLNTNNWYCGMVMGCPGWLSEKSYPDFANWPSGEAYFNTRYVWAHSEFTPRQTMRGKQALYGYLYALGESSPLSSFNPEKEIEANLCKLEMFPNPTSSGFTIRLPDNTTNAFLYVIDLNGKVVKYHELTENESLIETKGLTKGIYIVKAVLKNDVLIGKMMIK